MKRLKGFAESVYMLGDWLVPFLRHENTVNYIRKVERPRRMSILANGPSLKSVDLSRLEGSDFCTVNFSPLSDLFFTVRPCCHVLIDTKFFTVPQDALIERMNAVDWDLDLFVPYRDRKPAEERYGKNPHVKVVPVHCVGIPDTIAWKKTAYRLFRKGWAMPIPQNVLVAAIYCMVNAGYRQIELFGADHTWISQMAVDDRNRLFLKDEHFYDKQAVSGRPILCEDGSPSTLSFELRLQANAFGAYEMLQGYAGYLGDVSIINRTQGSFIDAFPR